MAIYALFLCALVGFAPSLGYDKFWYSLRQMKEIESMSAEQFTKGLTKGKTMVLHFTGPKTDDPEAQAMDKINDQMLLTAAQSLQSRNITVARMNMDDAKDMTEQAGVTEADTIVIFRQGKKHIYYGHRSAEALLGFVNKVGTSAITIIENKLQKKSFEMVHTTKVVGYFQAWPTNQEMQAFEMAALKHYPEVHFFAVITQEMAMSMKLTTLNEIHIVRPFEKQHIVLPQNPATEADITTSLQAEGKPVIRRVTLEDLHHVWSTAGESRPVAFIRENSPEGKALAKVFKNMAKYGLLRNATDRTILLIDPDNFPALVDYWQTLFNVDLTMPALGLLNVTDNTASWANLSGFSAMNTTDQIALVTLWLEAVSSGMIRVDGTAPNLSQAELEEAARDASRMATEALEAAKKAAAAAQAVAQANLAKLNAPKEQVIPGALSGSDNAHTSNPDENLESKTEL